MSIPKLFETSSGHLPIAGQGKVNHEGKDDDHNPPNETSGSGKAEVFI